MRKTLMMLLALGLLAGCKDSVSTVGDDVQRGFDQARKAIDELTPELKDKTIGEVEKLFVFEYHVEEVDPALPSAQIQERLAALGADRWDCFHIEAREEVLQVFCKRNPKTYLKFVPRMF